MLFCVPQIFSSRLFFVKSLKIEMCKGTTRSGVTSPLKPKRKQANGRSICGSISPDRARAPLENVREAACDSGDSRAPPRPLTARSGETRSWNEVDVKRPRRTEIESVDCGEAEQAA